MTLSVDEIKEKLKAFNNKKDENGEYCELASELIDYYEDLLPYAEEIESQNYIIDKQDRRLAESYGIDGVKKLKDLEEKIEQKDKTIKDLIKDSNYNLNLMENVAKELEADRWRDVNEELPEQDTKVELLGKDEFDDDCISFGKWTINGYGKEGCGFGFFAESSNIKEVTHWKPIQSPDNKINSIKKEV